MCGKRRGGEDQDFRLDGTWYDSRVCLDQKHFNFIFIKVLFDVLWVIISNVANNNRTSSPSISSSLSPDHFPSRVSHLVWWTIVTAIITPASHWSILRHNPSSPVRPPSYWPEDCTARFSLDEICRRRRVIGPEWRHTETGTSTWAHKVAQKLRRVKFNKLINNAMK